MKTAAALHSETVDEIESALDAGMQAALDDLVEANQSGLDAAAKRIGRKLPLDRVGMDLLDFESDADRILHAARSLIAQAYVNRWSKNPQRIVESDHALRIMIDDLGHEARDLRIELDGAFTFPKSGRPMYERKPDGGNKYTKAEQSSWDAPGDERHEDPAKDILADSELPPTIRDQRRIVERVGALDCGWDERRAAVDKMVYEASSIILAYAKALSDPTVNADAMQKLVDTLTLKAIIEADLRTGLIEWDEYHNRMTLIEEEPERVRRCSRDGCDRAFVAFPAQSRTCETHRRRR